MQPRDAAALAWLGEQFAAPWDVLSVLLARLRGEGQERVSVSTVRTHVRRWESAGWATSHRLPGGVWVTPTRRALEMVALPEYHAIDAWTPQVARLPHVRAVALVRLAFEGTNPPEERDLWGRLPTRPRWISDRLIAQEIRLKRWGTEKSRVPDAVVRYPDGSEQAIEVELTIKSAMRYRGIIDNTLRWQPNAPVKEWRYGEPEPPAYRVAWLTWPELRERLSDMLWDAKQHEQHPVEVTVAELPEVAGTYSTGEPWMLPYEAWRPER